AVTDNPEATIKVIEATLKAIWLAACEVVPIEPVSHTAEVKRTTSKSMIKDEGSPIAMIFFIKDFCKFLRLKPEKYLPNSLSLCNIICIITTIMTREKSVPTAAPKIPSLGKIHIP